MTHIRDLDMGPFQTIFCIVLISECIAGIGALFSSFQRATDTKTKIVAVTGATGLVGAPLVKALKSKDVKVRVLTTRKGMDDPENGIWTWSPGTSGFITSEGTISGEPGHLDPAALEGCDAVVHLAGENIANGDSAMGPLAILGRWTDAKKDRILSSRVLGTRLLVNTINGLKKKPTIFISASAVGYYGYQDFTTVFTEKDTRGSGFLSDVVEQWEREAVKFRGRTALMRFSVILSKRGGVVGKLLPLFNLAAGGIFGSGKQAFSWVSEGDAVAAILFALENQSVSGAVNVCSPNPATNEMFTKALGRALSRPAVVPLPEFIGKLIFGQFGEETILGGQRCIPEKLQKLGFAFSDTDLYAALKRIVLRL